MQDAMHGYLRTIIYCASMWTLALGFAGCGQTEPPIVPLLTECERPQQSISLPIGIGKDAFEEYVSVAGALIVGGYQGGHHLWGALRMPSPENMRAIRRVHMMVCLDDEPVAEALYDTIDGLLMEGRDIFGVPIVFNGDTNVWTLDGTTVNLLVGVETAEDLYSNEGMVTVRCCGHVADGD